MNAKNAIELKEKRQQTMKKIHEQRKCKTKELFTDTINNMLKHDEVINFNTVSLKSGISKSTLYSVPEYKNEITRLRKSPHKKQEKSIVNNIGDESYLAIIDRLKARIKRLEAENTELKKYIKNYK